MPFKNYPSTSFPPDFVDVQIRFTGLLNLRPGAVIGPGGETECIAATIIDLNHELKIYVTDSNEEPIPIPAAVGSQEIKPLLTIYAAEASTGNSVAPKGVTKFLSTDKSVPFPGLEGDSRLDFRWAVDLKSFHPTATPVTDPPAVKSEITLKEGVLFTTRRTDNRKMVVKLARPGASPPFPDINRVATIIGANIYLDVATALVLQWTDNGVRRWQLPKGGINGGPYHVVIDNGPKDQTVHDDLEDHYRAITLTPPTTEHFRLYFYPGTGPGFDLFAGVDAPCMATGFDGEGRT